MNTYIYHLTFKGPVHFGSHGIGLEETTVSLGSDSLCSALINAFALLGKAEEAVNALCQDKGPSFVLSSLFPYGTKNDGSRAYTVPRPLCLPEFENSEDARKIGKKLKKRTLLEPAEAALWLAEKPLTSLQAKVLAKNAPGIGDPEEPEKSKGWWVEDLLPRVALDRSSSNSNIWWCATLHFMPGCGLYGIIHVRDETWQQPLLQALELLGQMGLGGERTYGMGEFLVSELMPIEKAADFSDLFQTPRALLLSRYFPASRERNDLRRMLQAWDVMESRGHVVSGRHTTSIKRKRLMMLTEGSVASQPLVGAMVDVTPGEAAANRLEHPIFRCGLGCWVGRGGTA